VRILLVQPPYDLQEDDERQVMPPLGLAFVAAVLEQHGHEVRILDCIAEGYERITPQPDGRFRHGLGDDAIDAILADYKPALVGVSCLFSAQAPAAHHVCERVKQIVPGAFTIMGGAHPSAVPDRVCDDSNVDAVCIGEGELTLVRLVESLARGCFPPPDARGLAFRRGGRTFLGPPADRVSDLDTLPMPARHLLPMKTYFERRAPHGGYVQRHPCTNLITSRGCPARCCFCSIHTIWGRKFRAHSPARVIAELEHLIETYGVREVQFEDDNLTLHKPRIRAICQAMIERRLDLTWSTPNGAAIWALDEPLIELMRRAGCHHITLAVESGSQRVLREIVRKPLDLKKVKPVIRACRKVGMTVSVFFVVGFPGETRREIEETFAFAMDLDVDQACFFTATPLPGTDLYRQCVAAGLLREPVAYSRLRVGRPLFDTADWTAAELADMTRRAQARFYRRAVLRHPVQFLRLGASKLRREPRVTLDKIRQTLLPGRPLRTTRSNSCSVPVGPTPSL